MHWSLVVKGCQMGKSAFVLLCVSEEVCKSAASSLIPHLFIYALLTVFTLAQLSKISEYNSRYYM